MVKVSFKRTFSAAHRIADDPGKCRNIHGHNYVAYVTIGVDGAWAEEEPYIIAYDKVKKFLDSFDHALLLKRDDPLFFCLTESLPIIETKIVSLPVAPTTERLAAHIASQITSMFPKGPPVVVDVVLSETDSIAATATSGTK